ncbi:MAG: GYF domain-containing protein [Spirochaetaceae bacterium]|jgi:hypothetical protein|nr:GYF domain-containing protein [Spirochaetaceae bacterium]
MIFNPQAHRPPHRATRARRTVPALALFLLLGSAAGLNAQQAVVFGVEAGAAMNIFDYNKLAIRSYKVELVNTTNFAAVQEGISLPIVASLFTGYEFSKNFGIRVGLDFYINATDKFLWTKLIDGTASTPVSYTYSFLNLPLLANVYFLNGSVFRMGFSLGPYFSIPLGDVERTGPVGTYANAVYTAGPSGNVTIPQQSAAGIQAGLLTEFKLGPGALTCNLDFVRELWASNNAMLLSGDPVIPLPGDRQKATILQGIKITLGYKFRIALSAGAAEAAASGSPDDPAIYHMVIGAGTDGPYTMNDLTNLHQSDVLKPDTLLWKDGMANWENAESFPELESLFNGAQ